jgi:predicted RNA-binding protein with PUA-like domain
MLSHFFSPVVERDFPQWRLVYESAIRETDHNALFKRVEVAEAAILTQREMLTLSSVDFAEWQQIERALKKLRHLKKEVLKFY